MNIAEPDREKQSGSMGPMDVGVYTGEEKRSGSTEPADVGVFVGLARIEKLVAKRYTEHDQHYADEDETVWQNLYSLMNHCTRVKMVAESIARDLCWSEYDTRIVCVAGLTHDIGKLNTACQEYRKRTLFTTTKRAEITETHQKFSELDVVGQSSEIRRSDRPIIASIATIVRYHHHFYKIRESDLLEKCACIHFSDLFVSFQEERYRPGLSQFEAVDVVTEIVSNRKSDPLFMPHIRLMETMLGSLERLYGNPLKNGSKRNSTGESF